MASSTTLNGFTVPLITNTGWRCADGVHSTLGNFKVSRFGDVWFKSMPVAVDAEYASAVYAVATAQTLLATYATEAAAEVLAMLP